MRGKRKHRLPTPSDTACRHRATPLADIKNPPVLTDGRVFILIMIAGVQFMSLLRRKDTAFVPAEHRTTNTFCSERKFTQKLFYFMKHPD